VNFSPDGQFTRLVFGTQSGGSSGGSSNSWLVVGQLQFAFISRDALMLQGSQSPKFPPLDFGFGLNPKAQLAQVGVCTISPLHSRLTKCKKIKYKM